MIEGFYNLILSIGIVQGTALSFILFLRKFQKHHFLAIIIVVLTFSSIVSFLWRSDLILKAPHLLGVTMPMLFLLGPCYYLYIKSLFEDLPDYRRTSIHFIPAIVCLMLIIPFYSKSGEAKLLYILNTDTETMQLPLSRIVGYGLLFVHLAGYLLITNRYISLLQPEKYKHFHHWNNWARILRIGLNILTFIYGIVYSFYLFSSVKTVLYRDLLQLIITFFIHLIAFGMMYQTSLADKPGSSKRTTVYNDELIQRLSRYFEVEKPFLDPKLKLSETAKVIGLTSQRLSELVNQHFGKSFTDIINGYRVGEVKRILLEQKYDVYDMDGIAHLSGFQSRSNLTRVFKKHTGLTPSEFRNHQNSSTVHLKR